MADVLQILKSSGARPRVTFYADGATIDLDSSQVPTVTITKPDGTTIPSGTVSHVGAVNSGTYEFTLAPLANLTLLTVLWAGPIGGVTQTLTTYVEVVGGFLFTLAAVRAVKVGGTANAFQSTTDYPEQTLLDRRSEVTDDFEQRTGWSFVPRFTRERHSGDGTSTLNVRQYKPGTLLSVTIDGVVQTLADFDLTDNGTLTWTVGRFPTTRPNNVVVEYVRGFDRTPAEISEVGLARVASLLLPSQAGSTVSNWTTPDGTTYSYDQAGQSFGGGRRYYGIPKIDSVLSDPAYNARRGGVFA